MTSKPTVALIGLGGALGQYTLNALTSAPFAGSYQLPIKAFTRDPSKYTDSDGIKYYKSNLDEDYKGFVESLKGVDVFVDLTGVHVDSVPIIDAAHEAGVKMFITSEFSADHRYHRWNKIMQEPIRTAEYAESKPNWKTVRIFNGGFAEYFLAHPSGWGIDAEGLKYNRIEGGDQYVSVTYLEDVGKVVASVARLDPAKVPNVVKIYGDLLSLDELAKLVEKQKGIKLEVETKPWQQAKKEADEADARNDGKLSLTDSSFLDFLAIVQALFTIPEHREYVDFSNDNHNELVNPGLFEWKKVPKA